MRKNRIWAALVALVMVLMPMAALAAEGDASFYTMDITGSNSNSPEGVLAWGDTLYILKYDEELQRRSIFTWKAGQESPVELMPAEQQIDYQNLPEDFDWSSIPQFGSVMFVYEDTLLLLDTNKGELYQAKDGKLEPSAYKVDLSSLQSEYGYYDAFRSYSVIEGGILALMGIDSADYERTQVWRINLQDGSHTAIDLPREYNVQYLCAYKPGKALVMWTPSYRADRAAQEDWSTRLQVLDLEAGKLEGEPVTLGNVYGASGLAYNAEKDIIYYAQGTKIMRTKGVGQEAEVAAYLPVEAYHNIPVSLFSDGRYAISSHSGLFVRNVEGDVSGSRMLGILGGSSSGVTLAFQNENPDILLDFLSQVKSEDGKDKAAWGLSTEEVVGAIVAEGSQIDVLHEWGVTRARTLAERGYLVDLGQSPVIKEAVSRMYPAFREAITVDGKIIGVPESIYPNLWKYNKEKMDELGLAYPETMAELIDLIARWENEFKEDHPEIELISTYGEGIKNQMFSMALQQYMLESQTPEGNIRFDTPEFREIMQKIEQLPGEFSDPNAQSMGIERSWEYIPPLIEMNASLEYFDDAWSEVTYTMAVPPRIYKDGEPLINASINVYAISAQSKQLPEALRLLEFMVKNQPPAGKVALYADEHEPVSDRWMLENIESTKKELAREEERQVPPEEQKEHEQIVQSLKEELARQEARKYTLGPDSIKAYDELARYLHLDAQGNLLLASSGTEELGSIITRYAQGQLSADQMIRELDRIAQMVYMERVQ